MKKFLFFFLLNVLFASFQEKDFSYLMENPPFPKELISLHLKLYSGYVANTNNILQLLEKTKNYQYSALKQRFSFEYNGMKLHELYFENISNKAPLLQKHEIKEKIIKQFGSISAWKENLINTAMIRGIGWVILYTDKDNLTNNWVSEHSIGNLESAAPLLVLDIWEHAYLTIYGLDRKKYVNDFIDKIDWDIVEKRYQKSKQQFDF